MESLVNAVARHKQIPFIHLLTEMEQLPPEEADSQLFTIAQRSRDEGIIYHALRYFTNTGDKERVRSLAPRLPMHRFPLETLKAYSLLGEREKAHAALLHAVEPNTPSIIDYDLGNYLGKEFTRAHHQHFQAWARAAGYDQAISIYPNVVANMTYHLASDYDRGIGIAKGGLHPTYLLSLFGVPCSLVEAHKHGPGATFRHVSELPDIQGKRVAVIDKDVRTGRTARRVLREIQKRQPASIDLILTHGISRTLLEYPSTRENIPAGYNRVRCPEHFSYKDFRAVEATLRKHFSLPEQQNI